MAAQRRKKLFGISTGGIRSKIYDLVLFTPLGAFDIRTYSYHGSMGVRTRAVLKRVADGGGMHLPATVERPVERGELVLDLCEAMIDIAAALYNVSSKELREPGRSTIAVTRVRQIAMYVAHVGCGLSMRQVGLGFGRDRTTVLYACHTIEDLRDDEEFDRHIALTERIVRAAFVRREEA